ncbi:GNAT family N-acetyltransferase [Altererythrobacter aerius]|uniref:GNAT family N-acetyltransferase n=1 Tax=Tsuneonella aeria TaxID=1837929 RepID=A0A6I4TF98_9SPHN|nr:GNAT family N-acetyltransferase [Tsuneonella aeria]MXO75394.1 GNAT family N-acetyltransferase [Tsuneonella aeria]
MMTRRMGSSDLPWATELLTAAFDGLPPATHLFHGPGAGAKLAYFMRCGCRYALLYGECHTTEERDAAALWLVPGATQMTPVRMLHAGMFAAPMRFGLRDFRAFAAFAGHTDKVHRQAVPGPHYYLLTLGVAPESRGKGAGGRLLRQMLRRADDDRMPVYLETQRSENVPIYERFGFQVTSIEPVAHLGLRNWGMLRHAGS